MNEQLPLKLSFPESLRFDNFVPGNNQQAIASLKPLLEQPVQSVFLWGAVGTGKSHLSQALYHFMQEQDITPAYIDSTEQGI